MGEWQRIHFLGAAGKTLAFVSIFLIGKFLFVLYKLFFCSISMFLAVKYKNIVLILWFILQQQF